MAEVLVRVPTAEDNEWAKEYLRNQWGSDVMVVHGKRYITAEQPMFIALLERMRAGIVTYQIDAKTRSCEILSLDSLYEGVGVGSALIQAVKVVAVEAGCKRLWLITTNDNIKALQFYQRRGFRMVKIHLDAVNESRKIKPEIPMIAENGIPLQDEIEFEMVW